MGLDERLQETGSMVHVTVMVPGRPPDSAQIFTNDPLPLTAERRELLGRSGSAHAKYR